MMYRTIRFMLLAVTTLSIAKIQPVAAQRQQKHDAAVAASAEVHPVLGGQKFTMQNSPERVFAAVVKYLNSSDHYSVESADKNTGLIATSMDIKGGWRQTGTRVLITVISDSDSTTTIRVTVTEQKRYKAAQTEPWSDPKVDDKASVSFAAELQPALVAALSKEAK